VPPKVEYNLTELGETLIPLLAGLKDWAESHLDEVLEAREAYNATKSA